MTANPTDLPTALAKIEEMREQLAIRPVAMLRLPPLGLGQLNRLPTPKIIPLNFRVPY